MQWKWNFLGLIVWIMIVVAIILTVINIRHRHLKMIIVQKKHHSAVNAVIDVFEVGLILIISCLMFYLTFLNKVDLKNPQQIRLTYEVHPLVMQTQKAQGFYVQAKQAPSKNTMQYYTYWVKGAKVSVPGNNASISDGRQPIGLNAKNYPWPDTAKYDQHYQYAYVLTMVVHYRNTWRNGLGFHAGAIATDYSIIRVPSSTFVQILK